MNQFLHTSIRFKMFQRTFLSLLVCFIYSSPLLFAEENQPERDLPGYYQFFMKTGKLTRIDAEVKRDEKIQSGKISPVEVDEPVLSLRLPDGQNQFHNPRDYLGKKNLVLITGRAWW